ncbi:hypothetical protein AWC38_SpisGene23539 [Stylophora pistillata]|uniref:Uncharacterized protein n=1 Tax=Stylophora pistillata TaxID=50429 RepID=A0A2B4R801_STYPI|nr:hypothetical protein AWC38_SpisGene23539 [Stylophora pistillata]
MYTKTDGDELKSVKLLTMLTYKAAQVNSLEFVDVIFSTSVGKVVFNQYRNNLTLPEDVARANGRSILGNYLENVNKRAVFGQVRLFKTCRLVWCLETAEVEISNDTFVKSLSINQDDSGKYTVEEDGSPHTTYESLMMVNEARRPHGGAILKEPQGDCQCVGMLEFTHDEAKTLSPVVFSDLRRRDGIGKQTVEEDGSPHTPYESLMINLARRPLGGAIVKNPKAIVNVLECLISQTMKQRPYRLFSSLIYNVEVNEIGAVFGCGVYPQVVFNFSMSGLKVLEVLEGRDSIECWRLELLGRKFITSNITLFRIKLYSLKTFSVLLIACKGFWEVHLHACIQDSEDTLMREEEVVKADLKVADELTTDAISKLHDALSATAVNIQIVNVATMMLDTAKTKRDQAMQSLEKIGKKRNLLTDKQHKLLDKAMSSTANAAKKKRAKLRLITQSAKRGKTV